MADHWRFMCRLEARGTCAIKPWLQRISVKGQANLDRTIEHLRSQPEQNWSRPKASPLGNHLYVIHFKDQTGMQHRVFGHFAGDNLSFVMTLTGYEKDDTYHPPNYQSTTDRYRTHCEGNRNAHTIPCLCLDPTYGDPGEPVVGIHPECRTCICPDRA
jgi:hypothetical protein